MFALARVSTAASAVAPTVEGFFVGVSAPPDQQFVPSAPILPPKQKWRVLQSPDGLEWRMENHHVLMSFTQLENKMVRLLALLERDGERSVFFDGKFVGGSWEWRVGSGESNAGSIIRTARSSFIKFHHSGDKDQEIESLYEL
jgi:hypothetical protein